VKYEALFQPFTKGNLNGQLSLLFGFEQVINRHKEKLLPFADNMLLTLFYNAWLISREAILSWTENAVNNPFIVGIFVDTKGIQRASCGFGENQKTVSIDRPLYHGIKRKAGISRAFTLCCAPCEWPSLLIFSLMVTSMGRFVVSFTHTL